MAISNELRKLVDPHNECCCEHCLGNKCKEWASNNSIYGIGSTFNEAWIYLIKEDEFIDIQFKEDTEPEAIFKATSYIMEQSKKKD